MYNLYLLLLILFIVLGIVTSLLYVYNKKLFAQLILILMKLFEKMLLCSGEKKYNLVVEVVLSTLKTLQKIIYIPINEEKIKAFIQTIYDTHKEEIKKVISIWNKEYQSKIIKEIEKELCDYDGNN